MRDSESQGNRLDAAIDRAVRDLMTVEPPADLRERVLAKIGSRSTGVFAWPRLAVAAAALTIIALAVALVSRTPDTREPEQTVATSQPSPGTAPTTREADPPPVIPPPAATPKRPQRTIPSDDPAPTPATRVPTDRLVQAASIDLVAPLDTGTALQAPPFEGLPPILVPAIETPVTSITPITIERIEVPPIKR